MLLPSRMRLTWRFQTEPHAKDLTVGALQANPLAGIAAAVDILDGL